jgi:WD40 repeat protein/serine/threonine protein kinase
MALSPVASFLEALRTTELLPPARLDEATREGARLKDFRVLARNLLQRGWLTPFQANQLVQGRGADLILGPYVLLERLGEGARGQVFKARHRIMNRVVCLNVIRKDLLADPEAVEQFYREVQTASQLDHPNVVYAYDAGPAGPTHFLATEFVEGIDLRRLVKESGPLPVRQAAAYVIQAALGLQHASERGLVHRDIQPTNLFVTGLKKQGGGSAAVEGDLYTWGVLKILDFGLGRVLRFAGGDSVRLKAEHGAPEYLAPEVLDGGQTADSRADIYSLGCSFWYALTGKGPPLDEAPLSLAKLRPDVPAEVVEALEYMRAPRREDRIQKPSEVAEVLAGLLGFSLSGPESIPAPRHEPPAEPDHGTDETIDSAAASGTALLSPAEAAHERRLLLIAGLVLLLGLTGFAVFWFYPRRPAIAPELPAPGTSAESDLRALIARAKGRPADAAEIWQGFIDIGNRYPGTPEAREARDWLLKVPSPLDALNAAKVPTDERYPAWQPKELVGVLGEHRWRQWGPGVRCVACSHSGSVIATGGIGAAYLWDAGTGRILFLLRGHTVNAVAFAPDGLSLLTAGADKTIKLWHVQTGQLLATFSGHTEQVTTVAFAPDGQSFASGGNDKTVRIWDMGTKKERAQMKDHKGNVVAVACAANGKSLASASQDGTVKLWDTSGKALRTLAGHKNGASAVAFAPKDALLVSGDGEGYVRFWDPDSGEELNAVKKHGSQVSALTFTADGLTLATGAHDSTVRFWDVASRQEQNSFKGAGSIHGVAFAPNGQTLASAAAASALQFCDRKGRVQGSPKGHISSLHSVAVSPDCRTIATASRDATIKLWDAATGAERLTLTGSPGHVEAVAFSPDGQTLASAARGEKLVRLWDPATGKSKSGLKGHTDAVLSLAYSPDGQVLASGSADKTARLWDTGSGKERSVLTGATAPVTVISFSPDGHTLAWGGNDKTVRLWDLPANASKGVLKGHAGQVHALAFSPDGLLLASADERTVRFWDGASGKDKGSLDAQTLVTGLTYTADGQWLLATGDDGRCVQWKAAGRGRERDWLLPGAVHGLAAAADGRHVVLANSNGTAYIVRLGLLSWSD